MGNLLGGKNTNRLPPSLQPYQGTDLLEIAADRRFQNNLRWYGIDDVSKAEEYRKSHRENIISEAKAGGVYLFGLHCSGKTKIIRHLRGEETIRIFNQTIDYILKQRYSHKMTGWTWWTQIKRQRCLKEMILFYRISRRLQKIDI